MKIPEYSSQRESLNPAMADPKLAAQDSGMIIDAGEGLMSIGKKFQEVQDKTQTTQAEVALYSKFNEINNQAATDPDIWNAPQKAQGLLLKAVDDTAQGITSASARAAYMNSANVEMSKRSVAMNNTIRQKQLNEAKASVLNFVDTKTEEYWNSAHDAERTSIREQITAKVQDATKTGILNPEAAQRYLTTHMDNLTKGQVAKDMDINAVATLSELQKGGDGIYKDLNPIQRDQMISRARTVVVRQKKEGKEISTIAENKAEADIIGRYYNNNITTDDVIKAQLSGRISEPFAKSVIKTIESPEAINHNTDTQAYMKLVDDMQDPNSDPKELRQRILDLIAAGKLSNSTANNLYTKNMLFDDEGGKTSISASLKDREVNARTKIIQDAENEKKKLKENLGFWKSATDFIKGWGKQNGHDEKTQAEAVQNFYEKANQGNVKPADALNTARQIVNQKNVQANPSISTLPKTGKKMMDANGNKAIVYPDGSYTEGW